MTTELDAIARSQNWSEIYHLAETYRQQQQWSKAAIALQRAVELKSDDFWSWHNLGDVSRKLQQWQKAQKAYNKAVKLDSQFFWSWHNLGDVSRKLQQWQKAQKAYNEAVKLDSQFFWSWHNLGDVSLKLQQWNRAIASYLQAIDLEPEHQLSYQKLGHAFKQLGDLNTVVKYYRQVMKNPPRGSIFERYQAQPQNLIEFATSLTEQHQIYGAIAVCYMVLEIQPANTDILARLSLLLLEQQKLERAIASNQQQLQTATASPLLTRSTVNRVPPAKKRSIPGKIVLQSNKTISLAQLKELYLAVGWSNRALDRLKQAISNSLGYVAVWHVDRNQQQLVGFARAVGDGVYQATLLDIAVHPNFQGQGIGKAIVKTLTKQLSAAGVSDITLYASPYLADFYHKLGFSQPNNLQWMLFANPNQR